MAKEQQKTRDPLAEEEEALDAFVETKKRQREGALREKAIERSKDVFNAKIIKLQERAADFVIDYGKDDYRSQIMLTFLDVAIEMRDAINLTNDIGMAMGCITDAISCMDDILTANQLQVQGTLAQKYGFFERRKRARQLKKAINNNAGRMKQICDTLVGNQKMAQAIVTSLRASSTKMQAMMQKNNRKQAKKMQKAQGSSTAAPAAPSQGEQIVDGIIASRGATVPSSSPAQSAPEAPSTPKGGVDISDI